METPHGIAIQSLELHECLLILYTFRHHLEAQVMAKIYSGTHDHGVIIAGSHIHNERLVDF